MSKDSDLLKQLNNLPDEAQAPERWQAIQQQIESSNEQEQPRIKRSKVAWLSVAIAACALLVAILPMVHSPDSVIAGSQIAQSTEDGQPEPLHGKDKSLNPQYQLTINSLQQANAYYYAKLGHKVQNNDVQLRASTWSSLSSLRNAQQKYRHALVKEPSDAQLKQRLFWLYEKERALLRQLVV